MQPGNAENSAKGSSRKAAMPSGGKVQRENKPRRCEGPTNIRNLPEKKKKLDKRFVAKCKEIEKAKGTKKKAEKFFSDGKRD